MGDVYAQFRLRDCHQLEELGVEDDCAIEVTAVRINHIAVDV